MFINIYTKVDRYRKGADEFLGEENFNLNLVYSQFNHLKVKF